MSYGGNGSYGYANERNNPDQRYQQSRYRGLSPRAALSFSAADYSVLPSVLIQTMDLQTTAVPTVEVDRARAHTRIQGRTTVRDNLSSQATVVVADLLTVEAVDMKVLRLKSPWRNSSGSSVTCP